MATKCSRFAFGKLELHECVKLASQPEVFIPRLPRRANLTHCTNSSACAALSMRGPSSRRSLLQNLRRLDVAGRRHADDAIEASGAGHQPSNFHFLVVEAAMFLVEPEAIEATEPA